MIESVAVQSFQSISDLTVPLARFTVIFGPSNSGKSALVRALKLWRHNTSSSAYVQAGKAFASVAVDGVSIRRGKGLSEYRVGEDRYPKAGTSVPAPVEERMVDVQIVEQFDPPYLLSDSPSAAARVLGSLTGVGRLFAASREAQRRLSEQKKVLTLRQADLEEVVEATRPLQTVPERLERMAAVSERLRAVHGALEGFQRVQQYLEVHRDTARRLSEQEQRLSLRVPRQFAEQLEQWQKVLDVNERRSTAALKVKILKEEGGQARRDVEVLSEQLSAVVQQNEVCDHCPLLTT